MTSTIVRTPAAAAMPCSKSASVFGESIVLITTSQNWQPESDILHIPTTRRLQCSDEGFEVLGADACMTAEALDALCLSNPI